jgi:catechol 2,3-dioxygenase-like lactoylglutathione lyase family enzyme
MFNRISVISIPVSDQKAAKAFYTGVMGFRVLVEAPMGPDQSWVQLGIGDSGTSITLVTWFDSMPAGSLRGIVLETADIEATRAELAARSVFPSEIKAEPWGRYFTLSDPDGNGWVIMQPA